MRKVLGKICGWFSLFCASWLLAFNATAGVHFDLNVNVGAPGYFGPIPMVSGMVPSVMECSAGNCRQAGCCRSRTYLSAGA